MNVEGKLERIGLSAAGTDGMIAFLLIYCSLMVGIGVAMAVLYWVSKNWLYPLLLATVVVACFIAFRIVGSVMVGSMSLVQMRFIAIELAELAIAVALMWCARCSPRTALPAPGA